MTAYRVLVTAVCCASISAAAFGGGVACTPAGTAKNLPDRSPPSEAPAAPIQAAPLPTTTSVAPAPPAPNSNELTVGTKVVVGAGFIFEEGRVVNLTCAGDGSVTEGAPCLIVETSSRTGDTARALVHVLKAAKPIVPGQHYVCGKKGGSWKPCRTSTGRGTTLCEVKGSAPTPCTKLTVIDVPPAVQSAITESFAVED